MKYVKAKVQVVMFDNSDVVTASVGDTEAMGKDEWDQGKIDKEFGCDSTVSHVVKDF